MSSYSHGRAFYSSMCMSNQTKECRTSLVRWGEHGDGLVVVVWSSSEVATMTTTDTTTDDYTNDKPPPLPATKAAPSVPSPPRAAPGCVLGPDKPGWAGWAVGGDDVSSPTVAFIASIDGCLGLVSEGGGS